MVLDVLIAIAIFALVVFIAATAVNQYRMRAYVQAAMSDAQQVANALHTRTTDVSTDRAADVALPSGWLSAGQVSDLGVVLTGSGDNVSRAYVSAGAGTDRFRTCVEHRGAFAVYDADRGMVDAGQMTRAEFAGCEEDAASWTPPGADPGAHPVTPGGPSVEPTPGAPGEEPTSDGDSGTDPAPSPDGDGGETDPTVGACDLGIVGQPSVTSAHEAWNGSGTGWYDKHWIAQTVTFPLFLHGAADDRWALYVVLENANGGHTVVGGTSLLPGIATDWQGGIRGDYSGDWVKQPRVVSHSWYPVRGQAPQPVVNRVVGAGVHRGGNTHNYRLPNYNGGNVGRTDASQCAFYWGEKVWDDSRDGGADEPLGPLALAAP